VIAASAGISFIGQPAWAGKLGLSATLKADKFGFELALFWHNIGFNWL
jgi:hypothetical protein